MRSFLSTVAAIVAVAAASTAAHAHFVWATVENGQARFALLEEPNEAPSAQFEKYVANLSPRSGGQTLTLGAARDGARYAVLPAPAGVVTIDSTVGVRDREGEVYLLVYHAKGAASLEAAAAVAKSPAEITARRDGKDLVVSVRQDEWPVPATEVWVHWPGKDELGGIKTDVKGEARTPWLDESQRQGGFLGIRAMVKEAKAGEAEGKRYASIRRWATLSVPVSGPAKVSAAHIAAPATTAATGEKPFTQILRASYGVNHEVVSNAAFNQTLFEGKLTRQQAEIHLQQRALVHNEVHRILSKASPSQHVPYGAAQKNVLVLLHADLIAMGSGWPTEAQARPLTREFLQEIRESESKGPYFALGVQHVYYGGITNGGRMIGAKVADTLGFTPTYYAKSDGYMEYLPEVNKIADPVARNEMIRGGQAVYKYIIASSNEDVFKTASSQASK